MGGFRGEEFILVLSLADSGKATIPCLLFISSITVYARECNICAPRVSNFAPLYNHLCYFSACSKYI